MPALVQFASPTGPLYLDPTAVVGIGPEEDYLVLQGPCRVRKVYLQGGAVVVVLDTPVNLKRLGL